MVVGLNFSQWPLLTVAVSVAGECLFDTVPGSPRGSFRLFPLKAGGTTLFLIIPLKIRLRTVEVTTANSVGAVADIPGTISGTVVVIGQILFIIRFGLITIIPIRFLCGWINRFGHTFTREPPRHSTDGRSYSDANRPPRQSDRGTSGTACGGSDTDSYRVSARSAADGVTIFVLGNEV